MPPLSAPVCSDVPGYEGPGVAAWPVEAFAIHHPQWAREFDGLTVLHISDLHARRVVHADAHVDRAGEATRWRRILGGVASVQPDIVAFTGDYGDGPQHIDAAVSEVVGLALAARPRLACLGVFGNHDTPAMRAALSRACAVPHPTLAGAPLVRWIDGPVSVVDGSAESLRVLRVLGMNYPEDPLAAWREENAGTLSAGRLGSTGVPLVLMHNPQTLVCLASLDPAPMVVLAGHTHGGQVRWPIPAGLRSMRSVRWIAGAAKWLGGEVLAPHTSTDLPGRFASGCVRIGGTLCCISRGLGDSVFPAARLHCPRHVPLYSISRGPFRSGGLIGSELASGHAAADSQRQPRTITSEIVW